MKRSVVIGVLCAMLMGFLVIPSLYAGLTYQHEGDYPDLIMMYPPVEYEEEYGPKKLNPVPFSHDSHIDYDCMECHHTGDYIGCMEFGCHDVAATDPDPENVYAGTRTTRDMDDLFYFEEAYHHMCWLGCHVHDEFAQAMDAPTTCIGCHMR